MTSDHQRRVDALFDEAVELPVGDRDSFLDQHCGSDEELRTSLDSLLRAHEDSSGFLEPPVRAAAVDLLSQFTDAGLLGTQIGAFRLTELVASGGMGTVFKAHRVGEVDDAPVAVKVIRQGMDTRELIRRFHLERQTLSNLRHANIATLIDGGLSDRGQPYLVMEYIDGKPIDRYCDEARLSIAQRLALVRTVCSAVQYAHQNLVVHRDIKPNNVLVTTNGTPKLVDFGISKLLTGNGGSTSMVTATGDRLVTPQYASPEVIRGEPASTGMDVYSLGLVLYELLTGHRPYEVRHQPAYEIQRLICELDPPPPSHAITEPFDMEAADGSTRTITPDAICEFRRTTLGDLRRTLRGDLDTLLLAALHKDPTRRYSSVEQLSQDIDRYLGGFPILARKDSLSYRTWKFFRRHRVGTVASAVVVLSLLLGMTAATYGLLSARRETARARLEAAKADRINGFLQSILSAGDPEIGSADMKVREVLDRAAGRIAAELADEPEVRAAILTTIGDTYFSLGLHQQAEPLQREALTIRRRLFSPDHTDIASSMTGLGLTLRLGGNYPEAASLLHDALAMDTRWHERVHPSVVRDLNALAEVQVDTSDLAGCETSLREALHICRTLNKGDSLDTAHTMEKLAVILAQRGKFAEAEPLGREALAMNRRLLGEEHPRMAYSLRRMAMVLQQRGNLEEAEALYLQALDVNRRQLGSEHHNVARILNNLGLLVAARGRPDEGEVMLREALRLRRNLFGDVHLTVAGTLSNLATLLTAEDAEPLLLESLSISRKLFGNDHIQVGHSVQNLAVSYKTRGDFAAAAPLYREALAIFSKHLGDRHGMVAYPLFGLGEVLLHDGKPAEAEPLLRECLAIRQATFPSDHALIGTAKGLLSEALMELKRPAEAEALAVQSLRIIRKDPRATTEEQLTAARRVVTVYKMMNDPVKAETYEALLPLPDGVAGPAAIP